MSIKKSQSREEPARNDELHILSRRKKAYRFITTLFISLKIRIALLLLTPLTIGVLFAPWLATHDPVTTNYAVTFASPSLDHLFGTDTYGRDLFSRTLYGGRTAFMIGFGSVTLALVIGVPIGLASGYFGGRVGGVAMRLMDILMTFPTILLAILIIVAIAPGLWAATVAVGVVFSPRIARVVRASTLSVKSKEYVKAAEQRGESSLSILFREILPNIRGPIIVEGSIRIGYAMMAGAALSFLGLGAQPPNPDWGYMIATARNETHNSVWFILWPSIALSASILGFNLLGDGLSDVLEAEVE